MNVNLDLCRRILLPINRNSVLSGNWPVAHQVGVTVWRLHESIGEQLLGFGVSIEKFDNSEIRRPLTNSAMVFATARAFYLRLVEQGFLVNACNLRRKLDGAHVRRVRHIQLASERPNHRRRLK